MIGVGKILHRRRGAVGQCGADEQAREEAKIFYHFESSLNFQCSHDTRMPVMRKPSCRSIAAA
jgi:hypothetical protein